MTGLPLIELLLAGGLLLWAILLLRSPSDATLIAVAGAVFLLLGVWPGLHERSFVGPGLLAQIALPPLVGLSLLLRRRSTPLGVWHRRALGIVGWLILAPSLLLLAFVALGFMFGFHGRGYFNDPVDGSRNLLLTAIFIVSAAAVAAGLWGIYRSFRLVNRSQLEIEDPEQLAQTQQRQRRLQLVWGAVLLAGAASIYVLLDRPREPELRPGVIDCTAPGVSHPLCARP